jgi:hypothetical protein
MGPKVGLDVVEKRKTIAPVENMILGRSSRSLGSITELHRIVIYM